jgi:hypothetical protein
LILSSIHSHPNHGLVYSNHCSVYTMIHSSIFYHWIIHPSSIPIGHFIDSIIELSIWTTQSSSSLSNCLSVYYPFPIESLLINW